MRDRAASTTVRRGYVDALQGQVHYRLRQGGDVTLVYFHESPLSSEIFIPAMEALPEALSILAIDTPGYGLSDRPNRPLSIAEYAELIDDAMDRLPVAPAILAGSHTGTGIALEIWRRRRESIRALILTGLTIFSPDERKWRRANHAPPMVPERDGGHLTKAWQRYLKRMGNDAPLELLNLAVLHMAGNGEFYSWGYNAAFDYDPLPLLEHIDIPTLIINTDGDILAAADQEAHGLIPNSRLEMFEGEPGNIYWRKPDWYAEKVTRFLSEAQCFPQHQLIG